MSKDIDEIRQEKIKRLKEKQENSQNKNNKQDKNKDEIKKHLLRKILTQDARKRIKNIKLVDTEKAEKIESKLLQLHQQNRIQQKITDEQIKKLLSDISEKTDKSFNISRR